MQSKTHAVHLSFVSFWNCFLYSFNVHKIIIQKIKKFRCYSSFGHFAVRSQFSFVFFFCCFFIGSQMYRFSAFLSCNFPLHFVLNCPHKCVLKCLSEPKNLLNKGLLPQSGLITSFPLIEFLFGFFRCPHSLTYI